ncbi:MAG: hypothetical protein F4Y05_09285 [Acidimicrobiaceae bacterium]|nr:hypothetical protein [Acidimicrobiaceae bacterium]MYE09784.1 hypothetical protein [Acidimicrobiaceae bacterium]MYH92760.1 hypothetical protein [Acidimicrobiaceae bacterium]
MFLWFAACAVVVVAQVFGSGGVDYRVVALGAVLPLAENVSGAPWVLHTLAGSVVLLVAVMALTAGRGRRLRRRRWIGLPIGTLVFLVASGSWSRTALFWWPVGGSGGVGQGVPPEFDRPLAVLIAFEFAGLAALAWTAHRFGLSDPVRRRVFLTTGRLTRP